MLLFSNLKIFGHTDARVTTLRVWTCFQDYTVSWACILRESDSHYTTLGYFFLFFYIDGMSLRMRGGSYICTLSHAEIR